MRLVVFYSWQSDLPNSTNRGFIERALHNVAKNLGADGALGIEAIIDRDTAGVPGAPDIASTILSKIDSADLFVCDASFINKGDGSRLTPNPNVMVELGYAMKAMGPKRIILVMNEAYGELKDLPFDLRSKRVVTYRLSESPAEKPQERKRLEGILELGIRTILETINNEEALSIEPGTSPGRRAIGAIEEALPNRNTIVRNYLRWLDGELERISRPDAAKQTGEAPDDVLLRAIGQTVALVSEFAQVVSALAVADESGLLLDIYRNFAQLVDHYRPIPVNAQNGEQSQIDFYKFLGHELFVTMIAILLREDKLELVADLLNKSLYVTNGLGGVPGLVSFEAISDDVQLLEHRNRTMKPRRVSVHADILKERHTKSELDTEVASGVSLMEFIDADVFLLLRKNSGWFPVSSVYMNRQMPRFLSEAKNAKFAMRLMAPLGVSDMASLRNRIREATTELRRLFTNHTMFHPLPEFDPNSIGSD